MKWSDLIKGNGYAEVSVRDGIKDIRKAGWDLISSEPDRLVLDLDSESAAERLRQSVGDLWVYPKSIRIEPSGTEGHYHAVVHLSERHAVGPLIDRLLFQAALGSDPRKELASYGDVQRGILQPPYISFLITTKDKVARLLDASGSDIDLEQY